MTETVQVYHRRVGIGLSATAVKGDDDVANYDVAGFKGYDDDGAANKILLSCIAGQLLRSYVYMSMAKDNPGKSLLDRINLYWGIIVQNEPEFHDKYMRIREISGYDRAPGWIHREHVDDIARFVYGDRNTVYSQTPKELLEQIEKAGA